MKNSKKIFLIFYPFVVLFSTQDIVHGSNAQRFSAFDMAVWKYATEYCRAREYGAGYNESAAIAMSNAKETYVRHAGNTDIQRHMARRSWKTMLDNYSYKIQQELEEKCPSYLP